MSAPKPGERALIVGLTEMAEYNGTVCVVITDFRHGWYVGMRTRRICREEMAQIGLEDGTCGYCPRRNLIRIPPDWEMREVMNAKSRPKVPS